MSYQEPKEKKNDTWGIMFFKKLVSVYKGGCAFLTTTEVFKIFKGSPDFNMVEESNILCTISEFLKTIRTNFSCCIYKCVNSDVKISRTQ